VISFLIVFSLIFSLLKLRSKKIKKAENKIDNDIKHIAELADEIRFSSISKSTEKIEKRVLSSQISDVELLDIEEELLALRELYYRKLIDAETYIRESMKQSMRLHLEKH
jgi:hypothetical protein